MLMIFMIADPGHVSAPEAEVSTLTYIQHPVHKGS